jgi:uncharacterized membrane protein YeaQ/YmgE (transglycosylase-associated protein family)
MTLETFLIWLVIGLIAGWLASVVAGGGFGLLGDIIVGVVGAFIGGFIFRACTSASRGAESPARSWSPSSARWCCWWSSA